MSPARLIEDNKHRCSTKEVVKMSSVNFLQMQADERLPEFVRSPGTHVAGAGIIAALYLLARWFRAPLADIAAFIRRPRGAPPVFVPAKTLLVAAIALIPTAIGASILKNHGGGVEDVLNFVSFFGFVTVIAFFALLTVASAVAWVGQEGRK
jgi:hypothetical protein